jgi:hypothetical protein
MDQDQFSKDGAATLFLLAPIVIIVGAVALLILAFI